MEQSKEQKLLEELKKYIGENGYDGFFGLIARLAPENVDKNDLENYKNLAPNVEIDLIPEPDLSFIQLRKSTTESVPAMEASIYAEEHIPAVREDLINHNQISMDNNPSVENNPKVKVLEPERQNPNPWSDAETVLPGHLKLK